MRRVTENPCFLTLAGGVIGGVAFAIHIYLHLGDYTAERDHAAFVQIASISCAFGALVFLVLETARITLFEPRPESEKPFDKAER